MLWTGLDVLVRRGDLRGAKVGLVTNEAAAAADGRPGRVALLECGVAVQRLFTPEHGLATRAAEGESVADGVDPLTGLPVTSLFGERRSPTAEMLAGMDALVYDLQDVGFRPYTYLSTLGLLMQECARARVPVYVLDRPGPVTGLRPEGPLPLPAFRSFVGYYPVPLRYALTVAELATMFRPSGLELHTVLMEGWARRLWWDETGRPWVPPSPNLPTSGSALAFGATVLVEGTQFSEGRGTEAPFELVGAPDLDGVTLAARLNGTGLPGVHFDVASFTPARSKHAGLVCHGVRVRITDRDSFRPAVTGIRLLDGLQRVAGIEWRTGERGPFIDLLFGSDRLRSELTAGRAVDGLVDAALGDGARFEEERRPFLLYS